jgi:hypothetical protein
MPAFQYWFTGAALGAFLALIATVSTLGYAWFRAAATEQESASTRTSQAAQDKRRTEVRAQLSLFYSQAQAMLRAKVTADNVAGWQSGVNDFANATAAWIEKNVGTSALDRFLDMSGPSYSFGGAINTEHGNSLNWLTKVSTNLQALIERIDAYDDAQSKSKH